MHNDENGVEAERRPREDESMRGRGGMQLTALPVMIGEVLSHSVGYLLDKN